jgi:hypothetical protein
MNYVLKKEITYKRLKKMKQLKSYLFVKTRKSWYIVGGGVTITPRVIKEDDSIEGILTLIKLYNLGIIEIKK